MYLSREGLGSAVRAETGVMDALGEGPRPRKGQLCRLRVLSVALAGRLSQTRQGSDHSTSRAVCGLRVSSKRSGRPQGVAVRN